MAEKTHWKKLTNPDYLGAYALEDGKDMIVTIKNVSVQSIMGQNGQKEDAIVCELEGVKPMILNKTNMKRIEKVTGTPYIEDWAGHDIQLYTELVSAFGTTTIALRVREFPPQKKGE